jgi:adenylylsulfate kinase
MAKHIHPIFDTILTKSDKEILLEQKGVVVWMTGLSGSGKSTLARGLENRLFESGILTKLLDGDNLRTGLTKDLGFSDEDRMENIRRVAETARLFADTGIVTICSFVSPTIVIREQASDIIGVDQFLEVYVNASFDTCAQRDVKGLYARALKGEIKNFTGLDAPFEPSEQPFLEIKTDELTEEDSVNLLYTNIIEKINKIK